jgi:hypothetical protein
VPAGRLGLLLTVSLGLLATAVSMILVFVPPPGTANVWYYEASVILQTVLILAAGLSVLLWSKRAQESPSMRQPEVDRR